MFALAWLVLAAVLVMIELFTGTFYFLLLAAAAVISIVAALVGFPVLAQCLTFVIATAVMYIFLLPLLRKVIPSTSKTPIPRIADYLVGQEAYVVQAIAPDEAGLVKLHGEIWSAVASEKIAEGAKVVVAEVRVTKLFVTKG